MMNLGRMRLEAQRASDGVGDSFWSTQEWNDWLNEGALLMTVIANSYQQVHQISTVSGQQEYPLPMKVGQVLQGIKILNGGNQRELELCSADDAQEGSSTLATPNEYYLRGYTGKAVNHQTDGSLTVSNAVLAEPNGARLVLGLSPVPDSVYVITLPYYARHYTMRADMDVPSIPPEHHRGIVSYAVAMAKQKEQAMAESDRFMGNFHEHASKLRDRMIMRGQSGFPRAKTDEDDPRANRGGVGSMIVYEAYD